MWHFVDFWNDLTPMFFNVDWNPLLGHEVNLVCQDQYFFFFNGGEENRPEHKRIEKKVQRPFHAQE